MIAASKNFSLFQNTTDNTIHIIQRKGIRSSNTLIKIPIVSLKLSTRSIDVINIKPNPHGHNANVTYKTERRILLNKIIFAFFYTVSLYRLFNVSISF